jgi:hypothetical protein
MAAIPTERKRAWRGSSLLPWRQIFDPPINVLHPFAGQRTDKLGADCSADQFMVGMENSAPSLTPEGQREVTVLVLV